MNNLFERDLKNGNKYKDTTTIEREIKLARNIQMKLLNSNEPDIKNGSLSGISIPAHLIGGDYYDFYKLSNGKLRIIIGDVMGKGIPAAMLMILTRGAFRSTAGNTEDPAETLQAMNKAVYEDLRTLGSFVTVMCADWDPESNELTYASAGHSLPIICQQHSILREIPDRKGVMLGGLPKTEFHNNRITLSDHDLVLFYTDGITEAKNTEGNMYRQNRLEKILIEHERCDVCEVESAIIESVSSFTGGATQRDDITMVLLKVLKNEDVESSVFTSKE